MTAQAAGHFNGLPMLPASTILANLVRLLHQGFGQGAPVISVQKHVFKYKGLPKIGESLVLIVRNTAPQQYSVAAANPTSGATHMEGTIMAKFLC